jgi:homoserine O-acetyltransferase
VGIDPALFEENERTAPQAESRRLFRAGAIDLELGGRLEEVEIAFETWGNLSPEKDNAILVCHALSGDSHAVGWWSKIVGPGKAIDSDRYFVIGSNCLGGCQGSTGPSSIAPDGRRYGMRFPMITVGDMVEAQRRLVRSLGIDRLLLVAGGSMGGMQALQWAATGGTRKVWVTASALAHNAMQIGFNEVARQAILRDPKWKGGDYDPSDPPVAGLAIGRMVGHLSYLSEAAFEAKFGRSLQRGAFYRDFGPEFAVESYLAYQGEKFARRFDANSLLYLTRAIDYFECPSLADADAEFLVTAFTSDWIYPVHQSEKIAAHARAGGNDVRLEVLDLPYGHDAFLVDGVEQGRVVREFLA